MAQLTAERLAERLDAGESFTLIDTGGGRLRGVTPGAENVPYRPSEGIDDESRERESGRADRRPIGGCAGVSICRSSTARRSTNASPGTPPRNRRTPRR